VLREQDVPAAAAIIGIEAPQAGYHGSLPRQEKERAIAAFRADANVLPSMTSSTSRRSR
jgi:hypothetical protein